MLLCDFRLGQHRTIWQEHSAKDFASYERDKRAGILYVFPPFIPARMGRKIGRRPQTQLCGDAIETFHKQTPCFHKFTEKIRVSVLRKEDRKRGCLIKSQPLCKMHSSNSRAVHFAPPAGGLLNAQGAQGRPLHTSPAKFLCIFLSCCYFETTRSDCRKSPAKAGLFSVSKKSFRHAVRILKLSKKFQNPV